MLKNITNTSKDSTNTDHAKQIKLEIASLFGQTLYGTVRGLTDLRNGIVEREAAIAWTCQPDSSFDRLRCEKKQEIFRSFQIIVAAQVALNASTAKQGEILKQLQKRLIFDVTAALDLDPVERFDETVASDFTNDKVDLTLFKDELTPAHRQVMRKYQSWCRYYDVDSDSFQLAFYNRYMPLLAFDYDAFAKVKVGCENQWNHALYPEGQFGRGVQGKAMNQLVGLSFARNLHVMVLDMNQGAYLEEGFRFGDVVQWAFEDTPRGDMRPLAILGFTEHCFTRSTSLVGELMGAAEYTFVTIVQRALADVTDARLHYGHPDLFHGVFARIHCLSNNSHEINTAEDIFAGFRAVQNGWRVAFTEGVQLHKARDTGLGLSSAFLSKITGSAASMVRTQDLVFLNRTLPFVRRLSLYAGTIAFYLTNVGLRVASDAYLFALLLLRVSNTSFRHIDLAGGLIAQPWVLQLGWILAIPYLMENTVRLGLARGFLTWCRTIIQSMVFYAFQLQGTSDTFVQQLHVGAAPYLATGRGTGRDRASSTEMVKNYGPSQLMRGTVRLAMLTAYYLISNETSLSLFLRTVSLWFLGLACLAAPHVFQQAPASFDEVSKDAMALAQSYITGERRKHFQAEAKKRFIAEVKTAEDGRFPILEMGSCLFRSACGILGVCLVAFPMLVVLVTAVSSVRVIVPLAVGVVCIVYYLLRQRVMTARAWWLIDLSIAAASLVILAALVVYGASFRSVIDILLGFFIAYVALTSLTEALIALLLPIMGLLVRWRFMINRYQLNQLLDVALKERETTAKLNTEGLQSGLRVTTPGVLIFLFTAEDFLYLTAESVVASIFTALHFVVGIRPIGDLVTWLNFVTLHESERNDVEKR